MSHPTRASGARIIADRLTYGPADGKTLFDNLTLSFERGRNGLVGANGSGKTTLLRLLVGELSPASGSILRTGRIAMLPQEVRLDPEAPLSVVLGIHERLAALRRLDTGEATAADLDLVADAWDLPERAAAVLARFGLSHLELERPVGAVSGGEATRAALAGLALQKPDFLLLDEPTNHLDSSGREALYAFVEEWSGGLVCVSHDRALLRRMDRIVELSGLGVRIYGGNYDEYRRIRQEEDAAAERELGSARAALKGARRRAAEVRERQARREARGRRARASGGVPKILLNARKAQAEATAARLSATVEREVAERSSRVAAARERVEERERPRFGLASSNLPAGRTVLEILGATVRFPGAPRTVLEDLSLRLTGPERVAVVGPNGSGKSTLLRLALGRIEPDAGVIRRLPAEETAFLDQHGVAFDLSLSLLDNLRAFHPDLTEQEARYILARFLFPEQAAPRGVDTLSGGERLRASLACIFGGKRPPSLVVLDEPTNHLDLDATEALESALTEYDGALLVASHDGEFLNALGIERRVVLKRPDSNSEGDGLVEVLG